MIRNINFIFLLRVGDSSRIFKYNYENGRYCEESIDEFKNELENGLTCLQKVRGLKSKKDKLDER